jgi:hypothetical protein
MRRWTILAVTMLVSFAIVDTAEAKKPKKGEEAPVAEEGAATEAAATETVTIEVTGVADVDNIFQPAGDILNSVITARTAIDSLGTNLTAALGLPAGTPFKDALADLKTKAEGKVTLAMDGDMPKLAAADGIPANVQAAIDAVNGGMANIMTAATALTAVPDKAMEIVNAAKGINPSSLTGVNPTKIPKITKQLSGNIKILTTTPEEAKALINSIGQLKTDLTSSFSG